MLLGSLVGTWKLYDINITNLAVLLYAYRSANDTNSTYVWQGEVSGTAYVASIELNTGVKVAFDPIVGLTGLFVRVQDNTSFGDVMVELAYTSANSSCEGNSNVAGVRVLLPLILLRFQNSTNLHTDNFGCRHNEWQLL